MNVDDKGERFTQQRCAHARLPQERTPFGCLCMWRRFFGVRGCREAEEADPSVEAMTAAQTTDGEVEAKGLPCARCGKPAKLQCPKCQELNLSRDLAAYCSQDCFKVRQSRKLGVGGKSFRASSRLRVRGMHGNMRGRAALPSRAAVVNVL